MRNGVKIIIGILIAIIVVTACILFAPYIPKKYNIEGYGVTITAPRYYKETTVEGTLLKLCNNRNGIVISMTAFDKTFFNKTEAIDLANSYMNLMTAMNYEAITQNMKAEAVSIDGKQVGKASLEIATVNQLNEEITLIIPIITKDVVITFSGEKEIFDENIEEIYKIIKSISIEKNW